MTPHSPPQHSPFLPAIAPAHGEHARAQADELHDVPTVPKHPRRLSDMRPSGFFFD